MIKTLYKFLNNTKICKEKNADLTKIKLIEKIYLAKKNDCKIIIINRTFIKLTLKIFLRFCEKNIEWSF